MKLAKVIGTVVSTRKEGNINNLKILVVEYLDENLMKTGVTAACIDSLNSGEGDIVLLCSSSSARMTSATKNTASDNTIIAIVDTISIGSRDTYSKNKQEK